MNTLLSFFLDWKVKLTILIVAFSAAYIWHLSEVKVAVTEAVAEVELNISKENFRLKERSLNAQIELQQSFDNIQKDKDAKIKNLNARVASLTRSLQERPSRPEPSGVSNDSRTQESTGYVAADRLYRDDAAVAIWFATRTEGLKVELQSCYRSYDKAKETLDKFKEENPPKTDSTGLEEPENKN